MVIFIFLYFAALISCIAITLIFDIPLYSGMGWWRFPTSWLLFLWIIYYVVPFVIGIIFASRVRPFWRNFFTLIISIFAIHFLYSSIVSASRFLYVQQWQGKSKTGTFKVVSFEHRFSDNNKDGLIDEIILSGNLDVSLLPAGDYTLFCSLSINGQPIPGGGIGVADFSVVERRKLYAPTFRVDPLKFKDFSGNLDVNLKLRKNVKPNKYGKALVSLCRWAAFFCQTTKEGYDSVIFPDILLIQEVKGVYTFLFSPKNVQRDQVIFVKFIGDFGRDINGNGVFDELVIQSEFDSVYEGPIYFYAQVDGASKFFSQTTSIKKGITTLEFAIDGTELSELGFDGPYKLSNFYFLNNDPYCPNMKCVIKNEPSFSVNLERYTTKAYHIEQFE